jgi:hypothetical protein
VSNFGTVLQNSGWQASASWTPPTALGLNTPYYWRVRARDNAATPNVSVWCGHSADVAGYGSFTTARNCYWTGAGANNKASTVANWLGSVGPAVGDTVILDGTSGSSPDKDMTWDLDIIVGKWQQQSGYSGTVTINTVYQNPLAGQLDTLHIATDMTIDGGVVTHTANTTDQTYRLCVAINGNLIVGAAGSINVSALGYAEGYGPGAPLKRGSGSYGGRGAYRNLADDGVGFVYGSIFEPLDLGSGCGDQMPGSGGGAIWLAIGGSATIDGEVLAAGLDVTATQAGTGSGGSIYMKAHTLSGSGSISARGGNNYGTAWPGRNNSGGGGRIAVRLTGSGHTFTSFSGVISAPSGDVVAAELSEGAAGTVYLQSGDQAEGYGRICVDNATHTSSAQVYTPLGGVDILSFADVLTNADLVMQSTVICSLYADEVVDSLALVSGAQILLGGHTLAVNKLTLDGVDKAPGAYTSSQLSQLKGSGYLIVEEEDYTTWSHDTTIFLGMTPGWANSAETLINFPVLVRLNSTLIAGLADALDDGADIRFAKADGTTPLFFEIERWKHVNAATDTAEIWVLVDTLRGNGVTSIKMYWGKAGVGSESNAEMVFNTGNNFVGVWHLGEDGNTTAGGYKDATALANHGTGSGLNSSSDVSGAIGTAQTFNGTTSYITIANESNFDLQDSISISCWVNVNAVSNAWASILTKGQSLELQHYESALNIDFCRYLNKRATSGTALSAGSYFYLCGTFSVLDGQKLYMNGALEATNTNTGLMVLNDNAIAIGENLQNSGRYFNGTVDEVRIARCRNSASWIKVCYNNQKPLSITTNRLVSFAPIDTSVPRNVGLSVPVNGAFSVSSTPTLQAAYALDTGSGLHQLAYSFQLAANATFTTIVDSSGWQASASWKPAVTLGYNTTYYWRVRARDQSPDINVSPWCGHSKDMSGYGSFTTEEEFSTWNYSGRIVVNTSSSGANTTADVVNFPLLVRLSGTDFDFTQWAYSDGRDVRFADKKGKQLPFEIERFTTATTPDSAEIWVLVDTVYAQNATQYITMYWGKSEALSHSHPGAVFDSANGFVGVWHLGEDGNTTAGGYKDATVRANNGTGSGIGAAADEAAAIGVGQSFDGVDDYITIANESAFDFTDSLTISAWIKSGTPLGAWAPVVAKGEEWELRRNNANSYYEFTNLDGTKATGTSAVNDGAFHYLCGTKSVAQSSLRLYTDGVQEGSTSTALQLTPNDWEVLLGANAESMDNFFKGVFDEVRIENRMRSANWIKLCYWTQRPDSVATSSPRESARLPLTIRPNADTTRCSLWTDTWTMIFDNSRTGNGYGGIVWLSDSAAAGDRTGLGDQAPTNLYFVEYHDGTGWHSTSSSPGLSSSLTLVESSPLYARLRQSGVLSALKPLTYTLDYTVHGDGRIYLDAQFTNNGTSAISGVWLKPKVEKTLFGSGASFSQSGGASENTWTLNTDAASGAIDPLWVLFTPWHTSYGFLGSSTGYGAGGTTNPVTMLYDGNNYAIGPGQSERFTYMIDIGTSTRSDSSGVGSLVQAWQQPDSAIDFLAGSVDLQHAWEEEIALQLSVDEATSGSLSVGDTLRDVSGQGHHGRVSTIGGALSHTSGHFGYSGDGALTTTGALVSVADNDELDIGQYSTLMAWVKPTGANGTIMAKDATSGYALKLVNQYPTVTIRGTDYRFRRQIALSSWSHIAAALKHNQLLLYINGVLDTLIVNPLLPLPTAGALELLSGYSGVVDDIRIYRRDISQHTIAMIAHNGFRAAQGIYQLRADNNNTVHFTLDCAGLTRSHPLFRIANYWSSDATPQVWLNGRSLVQGNSSSEGDFYAHLDDTHNVLTVALNKHLAGQNRIYIDDDDPAGAQKVERMAQLSWRVYTDGGKQHVSTQNFTGATMGGAGSNQFYLDWGMARNWENAFEGELYLLKSSNVTPGVAADSTTNNNLLPLARTRGLGTYVMQLNADWVGSTWDGVSALSCAVVESSTVRLVLHVNQRRHQVLSGEYFDIATRWTVYPTGQIFRLDSLKAYSRSSTNIHVAFSQIYATDSTLYKNATKTRIGFYNTAGVQDLGIGLAGFANSDGATAPWAPAVVSNNSDVNQLQLSIASTTGATPATLGSAKIPHQFAWYIDMRHNDMSQSSIDSALNGIQYPAFSAADVIVGTRVTSTNGDLNGDGFNEAEGAFVVAAAANAVTVRVRAQGDTCRFHPVFRITNYTSTEPPRYVMLFNNADTLLLAQGYNFNMYHNKSSRELLLQLDTVLCDTAWLYLSEDRTLAVTMGGFEARAGDGCDTLVWSTESEHENLGFNLYRRVQPHFLDTLAMALSRSCDTCATPALQLLKAGVLSHRDTLWQSAPLNKKIIAGARQGVSYARLNYRYVDAPLANNVVYEYRLEALDTRGKSQLYGPVSAFPTRQFPQVFALFSPYPSPFRTAAIIRFALPQPSRVSLIVYDLQGRRVRQLMGGNHQLQPERYRVVWDGRDEGGGAVASGTYVVRLVCEDKFSKSVRLLRVH